MTRTTYGLESFVPAWLVHDGGYRGALTQHLRDRLEYQGYEITGAVRIRQVTGEVPLPIGMLMLRVETQVEEFDFEVGEG